MLVLADWMPPSYRAGGPTKSLGRIVAQEAASHDLSVITRSHDLGERKPHAGVTPDRWVLAGGARVNYASARPGVVLRLIWEERRDIDVLYVNSIFSAWFALLPLLMVGLGLVRPRVLLVAPRGELSPDAMRIRPWRKRLVLGALRLLVLRRRLVVWHASSVQRGSLHPGRARRPTRRAHCGQERSCAGAGGRRRGVGRSTARSVFGAHRPDQEFPAVGARHAARQVTDSADDHWFRARTGSIGVAVSQNYDRCRLTSKCM